MNQNVTPMKPENPLVKLHEQLEQRTAQFHAALPAHIPVERFKRVVMTAIQNSPALATADRPSLFNSAMKCAQDGLLPDGREAALVIYNTKLKINGQEKWVDAVQYLPMVAGIRKKVRNSKEIASWDVKAVYEKDEFLYEDGIELILRHKPHLEGEPGKLKLVYSVARFKTGEISLDVMPVWQVERIRVRSKMADKGPWKDHYDEMAKKTVAKRHAKVLPMSTDLDDLLRRDDDLYDMESASDKVSDDVKRRPQLSDFSEVESSTPADEKKAAPAAEDTKHDPDTGEIQKDDEPSEIGPPEAMEAGRMANRNKLARRVPEIWRDKPEFESLANAYLEGWDESDIEARTSGKPAKK